VSLWEVLRSVRRYFPEAGPEQARDLTLRAVHDLLGSGALVAGFPTVDGRGFEPWARPEHEIVRTIAEEWDALGRDPDIGDIVWFDSREVFTAPG